MQRNLFKIMTGAAILAMFALIMLMPGTLHAAPGDDDRPTNIAARLVSEQAEIGAGQDSSIAIAMTPQPGWHGYWLNGGDAGFGMQVEWDLPPGVTVGALAYPVPDTLVISGLMNHVYERPYALLAPLKVAASVAPGTRLPIRAQARWLACTNEICVPESASLSLDIIAAAAPASANASAPAPSAQFDRWRAALPQPLGSAVRFTRDGKRLRIAVPVPASLAIPRPHLFVETARVVQPGGEQRFTRDGDMLIIEAAAGDDAKSTTSFPAVLRFADGRGLSFVAEQGAVPVATSAPFAITSASKPLPAAKAERVGADSTEPFDSGLFLTALVGAIIGGLILNIMPCVFPILSLKALALARAGGDATSARVEGLAYTTGAVLTCAALGLVIMLLRAGGEAVGWAFQLQRPESVLLLLVLMAAMTANLAGLFEFGTLSFSFGRPAVSSASDRPTSPARSALATGALAAFVATPCSGPFLGSALGATLVLPLWAALPIFGGLGLGLALPFLALALIPALRRRLPAPGGWMVTLRRWLAVPMAATTLWMLSILSGQTGLSGWLVGGAVLVAVMLLGWLAGRSQRKGESASWAVFAMVVLIVPASLLLPQPRKPDAQASPAVAEGDGAVQPWSAAAQEIARGTGRPVFVYFTADWCVSCKVNEASSIDRAETKAAFAKAGVTTLVADWTSADPAITRELARHRRNSVPLYLWYPAGGDAPPEILPQILTPSMLTERAAAAGAAKAPATPAR